MKVGDLVRRTRRVNNKVMKVTKVSVEKTDIGWEPVYQCVRLEDLEKMERGDLDSWGNPFKTDGMPYLGDEIELVN